MGSPPGLGGIPAGTGPMATESLMKPSFILVEVEGIVMFAPPSLCDAEHHRKVEPLSSMGQVTGAAPSALADRSHVGAGSR